MGARGGDRRPGSIPAHAGKPDAIDAVLTDFGVYPRPRGEASTSTSQVLRETGLSPPTRGSREPRGDGTARPGSIPAHAGKPRPPLKRRRPHTVYPRPRGEAAAPQLGTPDASGLSPPTRGSLQVLLSDRDGLRSIPAHAGKPPSCRDPSAVRTVYPRPRGEAWTRSRGSMTRRGLSPPTRGSHTGRTTRGLPVRSIPAHAGKPVHPSGSGPRSAVYPRPRGEAGGGGQSRRRLPGLSPPTRGSLDGPHRCDEGGGSIPAHAGKPLAL